MKFSFVSKLLFATLSAACMSQSAENTEGTMKASGSPVESGKPILRLSCTPDSDSEAKSVDIQFVLRNKTFEATIKTRNDDGTSSELKANATISSRVISIETASGADFVSLMMDGATGSGLADLDFGKSKLKCDIVEYHEGILAEVAAAVSRDTEVAQPDVLKCHGEDSSIHVTIILSKGKRSGSILEETVIIKEGESEAKPQRATIVSIPNDRRMMDMMHYYMETSDYSLVAYIEPRQEYGWGYFNLMRDEKRTRMICGL